MKFKWKTEGTRPTMTVVSWPPAVLLAIIIGVAMLVAFVVTGKVADQEKKYLETENKYNKQQRLEVPR